MEFLFLIEIFHIILIHAIQRVRTENADIPTVSVQQPSYSVTPGNTVTLQCRVTSILNVTSVSWERKGKYSTLAIKYTTNTNKYSGTTTTTPSLTIFNVGQGDVGAYRCFATNSVGTGQSATTNLFLNGSIPTVSVPQSSYSVSPGKTVTLQCLVTSTLPLVEVYWKQRGRYGTITIEFKTNANKYSGTTTITPSLTIFNAGQRDVGTYTCFAFNSIGTGQSATTTLSISGSIPTVSMPQSSYSVSPGKTVTLQCLVNSTLPLINVYWTRRGRYGTITIKFTTNANKYSGTTTITPSLTIFNAEQRDVGTYICFAENGVGTGHSLTTVLVVTGSVPTVSVQQSSYSVTLGIPVTLQCLVTSTLTVNSVYWQRNIGGDIKQITFSTNTNKYSGSTKTTPSLTIFNAVQSDAGTYTCFAINSVGPGHSLSTTLTVTGSLLTVDISPDYADLLEGQSQLITCTITGEPAATAIIWYFTQTGSSEQRTLSTGNTAKYYGGNVQYPSLTILNFQSFDGGTYVCSATNEVGQCNSTSSVLRFISDLSITASLTTYSSIVGDSIATIMCKINGTPPAFEWEWTKTPLDGGAAEKISMGTNNAKRQIISSATNPNLNIFSITKNDEGIYKCQAKNGWLQFMSGPIILKVLEASFRLAPGEPEISKPVEYEVGKTVILTCSSTGGNPKPSVLWLMDDIVILSGTSTSTSGNVTSTTLIVTTTTDSDLEVYECQAYNGFLQRPLVKTTYLTLNASNNLPGQPQIVGAQRYELGDIVTLSCSSTGGNPLPTVNWLRDGNIITTGIGRSTSSGVTTSTLTFIAGLDDHLEVFECQADNDILQNPLSSTIYIELYFTPTVPILTGPTNLISGSSGTWTCSSMNGYPAPTISMSIQEQYYDFIAVYSYDTTDNMYTVAGTLDLILSSEKSGRSLCCNISQLFDNKEPQSVCLQLTINDKEEQNVLMYVAIGLIGVLLLFVLIMGIICYRNGFTLVRGKERENGDSKYESEQNSISYQHNSTGHPQHQNVDINDEELDDYRQEMHDYDTSEAHYSTVFEDNTDLKSISGNSVRSIP